MYAFPVNSNLANPSVSQKFGHCDYFAFYNGITLNIEQNHCRSSFEVIQWLNSKNVNSIISHDMGKFPYEKAKEYHMILFYSGDDNLTTSDMIDIIDQDLLEVYSNERVENILKKHQLKVQYVQKLRD